MSESTTGRLFTTTVRLFARKTLSVKGQGIGVPFCRGDANKLDFPDGSFDAVVSNYVYHNITGADKQQLLLETLRGAEKGRRLCSQR